MAEAAALPCRPLLAIAPGRDGGPFKPKSVRACLAQRITEIPEGRLVEYRPGADHAAETYEGLWRRSASLAASFKDADIEPGRIVCLLVGDIIRYTALAWACIRAGVTFAPLGALARSALRNPASFEEFRGVLASLGRPALIVDEEFRALGDGAIPFETLTADGAGWEDRSSASPICIVPTSGSTGRVKLAALDETAVLHRAFSKPLSSDAKEASVLSLFSADGISGMSAVFPRHSSWTQLSFDIFARDPLSVFDAIAASRTNTLLLTNSAAALLVARAKTCGRSWDLRSLRHVLLGSEPIVEKTVTEFAKLLRRNGGEGAALLAGYGTTETGALVKGSNPLDIDFCKSKTALASLGACAPGVALRVVDQRGQVLREGESGEVQAYCPDKLFSGYWNDPVATQGGLTEDGWWRTGDLGFLRNGQLTLEGRLKEIFISNGKKFSLAEIDACLGEALCDEIKAYSCIIQIKDGSSEQLAIVIFCSHRFIDAGLAAQEARRALATRFGLTAKLFIGELDLMPVSQGGKLQRRRLAEQAIAGDFRAYVPRPAAREDIASSVEKIWTEAFGLSDASRDFFESGGDSLKAVLLFEMIRDQLQIDLRPEAFFESPTLSRLQRLVEEAVEQTSPKKPVRENSPAHWPLPAELRQKLLGYFEAWDGVRPTQDRLVAGLNAPGAKPPLFWCFQDNHEFRQLAKRLGPDQPIYALRSGHLLIEYREDEIQLLALRYVQEIIAVQPSGPIFVGGNCQGGVIALAVAQHLLRRGRHVPLLTILDWSFPLQPYPGPVLMLYGRDNPLGNPLRRYRDPEPAWRRAFQSYSTCEIPGGHGQYFLDENVDALAETLCENFGKALAEPVRLLPFLRSDVDLRASAPRSTVVAGKQFLMGVSVENRSLFLIGGSDIFVGYYWLDAAGRRIEWRHGWAPLPRSESGEIQNLTLHIQAPPSGGSFKLILDLVEDGSHWLHASNAPTFTIAVANDLQE